MTVWRSTPPNVTSAFKPSPQWTVGSFERPGSTWQLVDLHLKPSGPQPGSLTTAHKRDYIKHIQCNPDQQHDNLGLIARNIFQAQPINRKPDFRASVSLRQMLVLNSQWINHSHELINLVSTYTQKQSKHWYWRSIVVLVTSNNEAVECTKPRTLFAHPAVFKVGTGPTLAFV